MPMPSFRTIVPLLVLALCAAANPTQVPALDDTMHYFFVLLVRPANAPQLSEEEGEKLQEAHMANIRRLHAEHKLYVAGPFLDDTRLRGIFVFKAKSRSQVKEWTSTDPAVKAGRLAAEIHGPWFIDPTAIQDPPSTQGLDQYTLVLLHSAEGAAPLRNFADLQKQHAAFLTKHKDNGNIAVAGDFAADNATDLRAAMIFRHKPDESAKIVNEDPLVKSGVLNTDIHGWATGRGVLLPREPLQPQ
jgi:uncharacterized protein